MIQYILRRQGGVCTPFSTSLVYWSSYANMYDKIEGLLAMTWLIVMLLAYLLIQGESISVYYTCTQVFPDWSGIIIIWNMGCSDVWFYG